MILIKDLYKKYISKKGNDLEALKNINIDVEDTGFVCILGKSGSGKSTLLNLIGGLDKPTSGDIYIEGQSISKINKKELDYYRSSYIGFIFQEFNVLEDLTVFENVALPLELLRKDQDYIQNKVMKLLNSLGIGEYKDRLTNELSGGQIQRVAIARALVKDPKIILADEPTGNIDSDSSLNVLKLLKELSKTKLVLMVTHDEETASNFADRIIEIKDGRIIGDINNNDESVVEVESVKKEVTVTKKPVMGKEYVYDDSFSPKKLIFPRSSAIKMALTNLISSKVRLIFTVLLFSITLVLFGFTALVANYDSTYSASKSFEKSEIYNYNLQFCDGDLELSRVQSCLEYTSPQSRLYDASLINGLINYEGIDIYPKVDSSTEIVRPEPHVLLDLFYYRRQFEYEPAIYNDYIVLSEDNHFELIEGEFPNATNEVVISDYMHNFLTRIFDKSTFVGKRLPVFKSKLNLKITGVFKTDYLNYEDIFDIEIGQLITKDEQIRLNEFLIKRDTLYTSLLVPEDKFINPYEIIIKGYGDSKLHTKEFTFRSYDMLLKYYNDNKILYPGNLENYSLKGNEIVIDASKVRYFYEVIANDSKKFYDIEYLETLIGDTITVRPHPSMLRIMSEPQDFTIKGYINDINTSTGEISSRIEIQVYVSQEYMDKLNENYDHYNGLLVYYSDVEKNSEFLKAASDINFIHNTDLSNVLYTYEKTTDELFPILISISIGLGIFTIVLINSFISYSITNKTKEIGILRAIGTKSKDVSKIFVYQGLMVGLISAFVAIITLYFGAFIVNNTISKDINLQVYIYNTGILEIIIIILLSVTIVYLSSLFTTRIITNKKPIDAIKDK